MENIFARFINFIKKIIGKKEIKQIPSKTETTTNEKQKTDFLDELKLYKEEEDVNLLKLQNQYEKNEIDLSSMTDEQIHDLNLLYNRQVAELKKKLNDKKTELAIMQYKIESYSANI